MPQENNSDITGRLRSALKAKAPIVAIPVDGHAPVCVKRSRLAAWAKGVDIRSVRIEQHPDEWYPEEKRVHYGYEGPSDLVAVKVTYPRNLVIEGYAGRNLTVKTKATFFPIDRRTAVKELAKWTEKERIRLQKKTMLGALSADQKKALKRTKFEDEGEGMIPVMVAGKLDTDPKTQHQGLPVSIPELPLLRFAVVRFGCEDSISYSVTELNSGKAAGFGKTAEEAICAARLNARSVSAERLAEIMNDAKTA